MNPGMVAAAACGFTRACSFVARLIFKYLNLTFRACFAIMFIYEVSMNLAIRRYWLALPDLSDVAWAAGASAVLELGATIATATYALYSYKSLAGNGCMELGRVQINIAFTGIISDLIAEHVALHGGLAYSLFLDSRILTISLQPDRNLALQAWALSFAAELFVDFLVIVPLLSFLPVSTDALFGKPCKFLTETLILLCACVHAHLVGLHGYLDKDRYFCN
eukprot:CAMPEP_0113822268 /NCGR_PEP_ID=MMETSP0328-20130328/2156_1 /TAXON_ID=39455 /ORGANISM="Alexandrium minutum" /LENGTH=220 /DNA_ID=CAMNT_0000790205 /DNA_START=5 /DNA_END=667 /DNA_ORIENTATION=+ /assembly_acc=CAM_ASM_000350